MPEETPIGGPRSLDGQSISPEETRYTPQGDHVFLKTIDSEGYASYIPFPTIQDAVNAVVTTDIHDPLGEIEVWSRGGQGDTPYGGPEYYQEQVDIDDLRINLTGQGISTRVRQNGSSPTINITNSDDTVLRDIWVENTGSGSAVATGGSEFHGRNINIEDAGTYGLNITGTRCYLGGWTEIKGGDTAGLRVSSNFSTVSNTMIHDELGRGIDKGIVYDAHSRAKLSNVYIMLNDATAAIEWERGPSDPGIQMSNVYIGPSGSVNGNLAEAVDLRGVNSVFSNVYIDGDVNFAFCNESVFQGIITGDITGFGRRTVINGISVNNGDPRSTGDWNGHIDRAAKTGARILNYSGSQPYTTYYASQPQAGEGSPIWKHDEPLDPTDLGSTSGTYARELAFSDGTTASNSQALYSWDGSNWVSADGTNTITPS